MREVAAGGVVYRRSGEQLELLFIHDRYGKLAIPKGKMEANERIEQTALREIEEETGISGTMIAPLAEVTYTYESAKHGEVNKIVHYFLVEATGGILKPQLEEIDEVVWLSPEEGWHKQLQDGYRNNDEIISKALSMLGVTIHLTNGGSKDE